MKKESLVSKKKVVKKSTRHYKAPATTKEKIEVVDALATQLKTENEIEAEMTKIAFDSSITPMLRISILQTLMMSKQSRRYQDRLDEQLKLDREKFEYLKAKGGNADSLTFEDTSDIDKEINMRMLGMKEKAEENGSTENNSVETVKR